jgi:hypothetical protein
MTNRFRLATLPRALVAGAVLAAAPFAIAPASAQVPAPAGACNSGPTVPPELDFPRNGADAVTTEPHRIDAQLFVPNSDGVPLEQMRVVLSDASPYATEAGVLGLDPSSPLQLPPPMPVPSSVARAGAAQYVTTWVPALKANTRYDVRIVLPAQGNCTYATLGSFTTGADS